MIDPDLTGWEQDYYSDKEMETVQEKLKHVSSNRLLTDKRRMSRKHGVSYQDIDKELTRRLEASTKERKERRQSK